MSLSVIQEIKKSVTFIFLPDGKGGLTPNGTGFFVGVQVKEKPGSFASFLVTAKHVLQDASGKWHKEIYIRLNKKDGGAEVTKIELAKDQPFTHMDPDVDIAAFACLLNEGTMDFKLVQDDLVATKQIVADAGIMEGDEVFFAGLFTSHVGQKKNQPIIRFGRIALMSDEKIEWKDGDKPSKWIDLYLLECQSFGGNSGSPVFFRLTPTRNGGLQLGGTQIYLAGVMRGSFLSGSEVRQAQTDNKLISVQNIGIAAVTPAFYLHEMLLNEGKRVAAKFE